MLISEVIQKYYPTEEKKMAATIHKYKLAVTPWQNIEVPESFEFLDIAVQNDAIAMWGSVRIPDDEVSEDDIKTIRIWMFSTGSTIEPGQNDCPYPSKALHLKTVLLHEGDLVLHIFIEDYTSVFPSEY